MEENIEKENVITDTQVQSKNLFLYDGPIGRLKFFLTLVGFYVIDFLVLLGLSLLYNAYGTNNRLPMFAAFFLLVFCISIWFVVLTYSKRIYDLIADKQKAVFYTVALLLANIAASFIPVVKYVFLVISLIILLILFLKPGKLVR